jgi:DNA-binding NtrC family response regulator
MLVGESASHKRVMELLAKVAPTDAEVLITGASGVGKELYARYVHAASKRSAKCVVAVNCGAVPSGLFESEFFGHAVGAFTGATRSLAGLFAEADGGTLFLDEVDSLARHDQVKLLRVLQEREYRRLGESHVRRANVRIIAGTNADLGARIEEGSFREDLYFRLRVVPVTIDPLRERREDVFPLLDHFAVLYAEEYAVPRVIFSQAALATLEAYDWPGNVRELQNCVRYLSCLQLDRPVLPEDLALDRRARNGGSTPPSAPRPAASSVSSPRAPVSFQAAKTEVVGDFEKRYIEGVLRDAHGNIAAAARAAGKHRRAFFQLLRKHDIDARRYRGA